jgi:hypothetical protein
MSEIHTCTQTYTIQLNSVPNIETALTRARWLGRNGNLAVAAAGQASTSWFRRTYFLKRKRIHKNTINIGRPVYLQCTKLLTMTLSGSNPIKPHAYSRKQSIGLPAFLSSLFSVWFWNSKQLKRARVNKLIMAGETAAIRAICGSGSSGLPGNPDHRGENPQYR